MADELSNEDFRKEMLRLMKSVVIKVGENARDIDLLRKDVEKNTREFKSLTQV
jgi:hypothetical protein